MAKYTFQCQKCETSIQMYVPPLVKEVPCKTCQGTMDRQMPSLNGPANVREVVDKNTGITWTDNQQQMIQDRKSEYYWTVEVPRFVASGTYSLETMLENDWIFVDDAGKIHTNNKPPSKR
jgi:DNA replicative helicase MCM subunit Mcm2 (Cdc46/Mcm family)